MSATALAAGAEAHERAPRRKAALQLRDGGADLLLVRSEPGPRALALAQIMGLALDGSLAPPKTIWARRAADGLEIAWYPALGPAASDRTRLQERDGALEAALLRSWGHALARLVPGLICARVGLRADPAPEPIALTFGALGPWRLIARSGPGRLGPGEEAWACFARSEIGEAPARVPNKVGAGAATRGARGVAKDAPP